ncbi:MAG: TolC family protein, partial [Acidobacteriota bacterium]
AVARAPLRLAIASGVAIARAARATSIARLERAERAETLFAQAVVNEERKLTAGSSTLIDVISQRDRLTSAEQRRIRAQQALANALVDLRFQTGTLLAADPVAADPVAADPVADDADPTDPTDPVAAAPAADRVRVVDLLTPPVVLASGADAPVVDEPLER